jgi:thioesterase domain-containing protein
VADPRLGWRNLCEEPVRIIRVEASHATLLHSPSAAHIAADLELLLKEASGGRVVT